ncbi:MAG: nucleotide-binding protein [Promethearchaeota archaeon]
MKKKPVTIAIVGKGGVGKTAITTMTARIIFENYNYKMLLIDADPTHPHLCNMVNIKPQKSLEQIRLDAVKRAHSKDNDSLTLAEKIDFQVYEGMAETKNFCLFSIGQPEGPGCFCPSNTLLRKVLETISEDFDLILIDCEAGLEQINRMVIKSVDILIIITDISLRSVETAESIKNTAKKFTNYKKIGVIINKVKGNIDPILQKLNQVALPILGQIPEDEKIVEFDLNGRPLIELDNTTPSYSVLKEIVKNILNGYL